MTTNHAEEAPTMTTTDTDQRTAEAVAKLRTDLATGAVFDRHAASHRSRYGYQPPVSRRDWSHAVTTIGRMAAESDAMAQLAVTILARIPNLYGTDADLAASLYSHAAEAVRAGFDNVLSRSGPEPCRYSDAQRPYTVHQLVRLACWLAEATAPVSASVPGIGWVMVALAAEERIDVTPRQHVWPSLYRTAANRRQLTNA